VIDAGTALDPTYLFQKIVKKLKNITCLFMVLIADLSYCYIIVHYWTCWTIC